MALKLTGLYGEPRWFVMGDEADPTNPAFRIRPYPATREQYVLRAGGEMSLTGERLWDKFNFCLVDWRNVEDAGGQPVPCNDATKRQVFDYRIGDVPTFVNACLARIEADREQAEKN